MLWHRDARIVEPSLKARRVSPIGYWSFVGLSLGLASACRDVAAPDVAAPPATASIDAEATAAATFTVQDLGVLPGGMNSSGDAINASGDVVGWSETAAGYHPVLWRGSTIKDLGLPFGNNAYATGVNNTRTVVGHATNPAGERRAFTWKAGVFTVVSVAGKEVAFNAVNNGGTAVGGFRLVTPSSVVHALRWTKAGGIVDLHPAGYLSSGAFGISDQGVVVGWVKLSTGTKPTHAARWSATNVFTDLGSLSANSNSWANGVNSTGRIVAVDESAAHVLTSYLWRSATQKTVLGPGVATGISNLGRISAIADSTVGTTVIQLAATRRNATSPWVFLPALPTASQTNSFALAVNACGTLAGNGQAGSGGAPRPNHALRWTISACDT